MTDPDLPPGDPPDYTAAAIIDVFLLVILVLICSTVTVMMLSPRDEVPMKPEVLK